MIRTAPGTIAVVEDQVDELGERILRPGVYFADDSLKRQRRVGGRSQGHEPLGLSLKLDQKQDPPAIGRVGGPDHVGMALLQGLSADELGRFFPQGREVDLVGPFGHVVADQDLDHATVGEDRLEEGIVHGDSVIRGGSNLAEIRGRPNGWMGRQGLPNGSSPTMAVKGTRKRLASECFRVARRVEPGGGRRMAYATCSGIWLYTVGQVDLVIFTGTEPHALVGPSVRIEALHSLVSNAIPAPSWLIRQG